MMKKVIVKFSRSVRSSLAILALLLMIFGCSGSDGAPGVQGLPGPPGASGDPGAAATSLGVMTGTVQDLYGSAVGAAALSISPAVEGVSGVTCDAAGCYNLSLPAGTYTITISKSGYKSHSQTVNLVAAQTTAMNVFLEPTSPLAANAGVDQTVAVSKTATTDYTLPAAKISYFDPSLKGGDSVISWSILEGPGTIKSGGNTLTPTVTLNKESDYKAFLVEKSNPDQYENPAGTKAALNRWRVVPFTVAGTRQPSQGKVKAMVLRMSVTNGGITKTDDVMLSVALPVVPNTGLRNVPVGQPVLLQGPAQATYAWTMTKPTGSTATLNDADTRYPDFIPDMTGAYTISEAGASRIVITAGKYAGMMVAYQTPDPTCGSSGACHSTFDNTARMNTWLNTGHKDVMFEGMREVPPGGHYSATCAACHTSGVKYADTAIDSGSFADLSTSEQDADGKTLFAWFNDNHMQGNPNIEREIANRFPKTYRVTGIQCEVCHGPNLSPAHGGFSAADPTAETARISYSSNTCGLCHGRPTSHGALQQWASSGHGNYTEFATDGHVIGANCAGCHSAQGFFILKAQMEGGNSSRTIAVPASLTKDNAEPVTCVVCHDPHDEGDLMVSEEVPIRIEGNTPLLSAGFQANGVGRGAQCIFCHNSRNGYSSGQGFASLHEDGDAAWGTLTAYAEPHSARQGDVLMGRNAYFFGSGYVGERSKHSFIADTCVECHMKLSDPPPALGSASRPDHAFGTTASKSCEACHGEYNGGTISEYFESQAAVLQSEIEKAITRLKGDGVAVIFYPGRTPKVSVDGGATQVNLTTYLANAPGSINTPGPLPASGVEPTLAKVLWNQELVEDGSMGAHNPNFSWKVFDASIKAVKGL